MNLLRRCHECGQPLGKKDVFCPRCGAKQRRDGIRRAAQRAPVSGRGRQFMNIEFAALRKSVRLTPSECRNAAASRTSFSTPSSFM